MDFNSKLSIRLSKHLPLDTLSEVKELFEAVHLMHREVSKLLGQTRLDSSKYAEIPLVDTIRSQDLDRLYTKKSGSLPAGTIITLGNDGSGALQSSAATTLTHGFVVEEYTNEVQVAMSGLLWKSGSSFTHGTTYYLSGSGGISSTGTIKIGFGLGGEYLYFNPTL